MAKQSKKQTASKRFKEPTDEQLQGNQHDKIIKESIEETMYFLLKTFGNIEVVRSEQLPTEIQQTQERKPDFLKIIVDTHGVERIGHIEFHVKDEADISYRAFETCAMMKRKKPRLSIFQIIVYMGEKPAENILTEWSDEQYTYRIKLIQFIKTPVELFLESESAAEIVLGILGNFGEQSPEIVIPQLVEKVVKCAKTDLERLKFLQHLRIFSKLRNFEPLINKIMENTIAYFGLKDEDDYMYKKGEAKTEARFQKKITDQLRFSVIRLLDTKTLTEAQIVNVLNVTEDFVQSIQMDLAAASKKMARLKKTASAESIAQKLNLPTSWVEKHIAKS
jgi:hypothetical protein